MSGGNSGPLDPFAVGNYSYERLRMVLALWFSGGTNAFNTLADPKFIDVLKVRYISAFSIYESDVVSY